MKIDVTGLPEWVSRPRAPTWAVKVSRIFAIMLGMLALGTVILLTVLMWPALTGGISLFVLLDELDDLLETVFLLGTGSAMCAFVAHVLRSRTRNISFPDTHADSNP